MRAVPNAWPGLDHDVQRALARAAPTAAAPAAARTSTGRVEARASSTQSSGTSAVETSTSAPPTAARTSPQVRQLARRAVERVLDDVAVLALLEPARRERHQVGQHELGVRALDADREPDHGLQDARGPAVEQAPLALDEAERLPGAGATSACAASTPEAMQGDGARCRRRRLAAWTSSGAVRFATTVGAHGGSSRVDVADARVDAVGAGVVATAPAGSSSIAGHRREPELRGRDRQHAAARSPSRPARVARELLQQLQAQPGRRVRAGAERQRPGRSRGRRAAGEPGRADRERADRHRRQVRRATRVSQPSGTGARDDRARARRRTRGPRRGSVVAVDRELDELAEVELLAAGGEQRLAGGRTRPPRPRRGRGCRAGSPGERPLELRDHALVLAQVLVGQRARELLEQVALLARSAGAGSRR